MLGRIGEFWRLTFDGEAIALIERHGRLPLPPYIAHAAAPADEERYQTVFARPSKEGGSVAAPPAVEVTFCGSLPVVSTLLDGSVTSTDTEPAGTPVKE